MPPTNTPSQSASSALPALCPMCHQPVLPAYYFCPNCGTSLHQAPLSVSAGTQLGIYAFSILLPMMGFILVTRWPGMKYYRSQDPQTRQIGQIAWILLIFSTIFTCWYVYNWTQDLIQSSIASINTDMSF